MSEYFGVERHLWAFVIGGISALLAILISIHSIVSHIKYNCNPTLKKYILIIISMVPVYALIAWLGLIDKNYTYAFDSLRECYEAFVIYAYFEFLLAYLSKGKNHMRYIEELVPRYPVFNSGETNHMFPIKYCLKPWTIGRSFLFNTMFGTFQYIIIKILCGLVIFILALFDSYTPGDFTYNNGYVYIVIIASVSQMWALYCLVMFYQQFKNDLSEVRPFQKFLCIKSVVFLTFWQGVLIAGLVKLSVITETQTYTTEQSSEGLQDFIICIQMLIASIVFKYAFPSNEFYNPDHISTIYASWIDHFLDLGWPYNADEAKHDFVETKTRDQSGSNINALLVQST